MNNSLAEVHPELVSEWSEKNLTLTHDDITFGSNKKVWWRSACGHEWQASVKARSNGEKCPICSGARVIAGINDLATLEPLLVKQWSKKNKIKPTEVSIGSHKKVIWRCEKGEPSGQGRWLIMCPYWLDMCPCKKKSESSRKELSGLCVCLFECNRVEKSMKFRKLEPPGTLIWPQCLSPMV